jgi:hypothetical protein
LATDLITGMASGYTWQTLQPFVLSLRRSGYTGRCVLIFGEGRKEEVGHAPGYEPGAYAAKGYVHPVDAAGDKEALYSKLLEYGVEAHDIGTFDEHPIMARFPVIADLIDSIGPRYVLSVDTKDIVFQYDPTFWLEQYLGNKEVCVVSEGSTYQQSLGNAKNIRVAFGEDMYESMKDEMVLNAGVIAGLPETVSKLHRDVHELALTDLRLKEVQPGYKEMVADQTAMNILLRRDRYRDKTLFATQHDGFVAEYHHLHYSWAGDERKFEIDLMENVNSGQRPDLPLDEYNYYRDGIIYPGGSEVPFAIFHQYMVNGYWWVDIKEKYKEESNEPK